MYFSILYILQYIVCIQCLILYMFHCFSLILLVFNVHIIFTSMLYSKSRCPVILIRCQNTITAKYWITRYGLIQYYKMNLIQFEICLYVLSFIIQYIFTAEIRFRNLKITIFIKIEGKKNIILDLIYIFHLQNSIRTNIKR